MKALEITVTLFDNFGDIVRRDNVYTIIPESSLNGDVVTRLHRKKYNVTLPDGSFIWSVTKRMELTEVEI